MLDRRRVVLERAAVAATDLDHAPAQPREQPPSKLVRDRVGTTPLLPFEVAGEARLPRAVERRLRRRAAQPSQERERSISLDPVTVRVADEAR